jgi:hypothetical protein
VTFAYRITIADLVSLREAVAQADGGSADLVGQIRAAARASLATEQRAHGCRWRCCRRSRSAAVHHIRRPAGDPGRRSRLPGGHGRLRAACAVQQWQDWLDHALTGPDVLTAQRLEDRAARAPAGAALGIDRTTVDGGDDAHGSRSLHDVERRVDASVRAEVKRIYNRPAVWLAAESSVVVVALMVAVRAGHPAEPRR